MNIRNFNIQTYLSHFSLSLQKASYFHKFAFALTIFCVLAQLCLHYYHHVFKATRILFSKIFSRQKTVFYFDPLPENVKKQVISYYKLGYLSPICKEWTRLSREIFYFKSREEIEAFIGKEKAEQIYKLHNKNDNNNEEVRLLSDKEQLQILFEDQKARLIGNTNHVGPLYLASLKSTALSAERYKKIEAWLRDYILLKFCLIIRGSYELKDQARLVLNSFESEKKYENLASMVEFKRLIRQQVQIVVPNDAEATEIPAGIALFTQLNILCIYANSITSLPKELCLLTKLKVLRVFSKNLTVLPYSLAQCTALEELSLAHIKLDSSEEENAINDLLKKLDDLKPRMSDLIVKGLISKHDPQLPKETQSLETNLRALLTNLRMQTDLFSNFVNLKKLELCQNKLLKFPLSISSCFKLEELSLQENLLEVIPKQISNLKTLKVLNLKGNEIRQLPKEIGLLTELCELNLFRNPLECLPEELAQCKKMICLRLSGYDLKFTHIVKHFAQLQQLAFDCQEIPEEIWELKHLKILSICFRSNHISDKCKNLTELENLKVSHGEIKEFPSCILALTKLKCLDLSHNQIQEVPDGITALENLEMLSIENNNMAKVSKKLEALKKLICIRHRGNNFAEGTDWFLDLLTKHNQKI